MATLEKIRSKAGLVVGVVGLALLAFVIGDLVNGGESWWRQKQNKILIIDGKSYTYDQYQSRINDMMEVYKLQTGQNSVPNEYSYQINQAVFENLVRHDLINQEAEKLGMVVSPSELSDMVTGNNISPMLQQMPFFKNPKTGMFDKSLLINFVNSVVSTEEGAQGAGAQEELIRAKRFWLFWENNIKQQRLQEKYTTLLSKAIMPNSLDIKANYEGGKTSVDFAYVVKPYSTIADSTVSISSSELKELYDKQKDRFKQEEKRSIKYVVVDVRPSKVDYEAAEAKMKEVKNQFATTTDMADLLDLNSDVPYSDAFVAISSLPAEEQTFVKAAQVNDVQGPIFEDDTYKMFRVMAKTVAPDSVKAKHIMLPIQNEAEAMKRADSLLTVLNAGAEFAPLVQKFSVDRNTANNGGEIGWFTESAILRGLGVDFKNACFSEPVNKYFTVRSLYGIHIVQVTERTKDVPKVKLAEYAMKVDASSQTFQILYNNLSQIVAASNNDIPTFEKQVKEKGLNLLTNTDLAATDNNLGTIKDARKVISWAFNKKPKTISTIIELDNKFVVVALEGITPKGYAPLKSVEPMLRSELLARKKGEMIVADLKGKTFNSLAEYASVMKNRIDTAKFVSFNTSRITGIGEEPALNGLAPYAEKNKVSAPVIGKNGVYVYSVYNKTENQAPFDAKAEKQAIENNWVYRIMYQSIDVLKNSADIQDHRVRFY